MDRTVSLESVKRFIKQVVPNVTIEAISPSESTQPLRSFAIQVSDGRTLVLNLPPSTRQRLLRSERWLLTSEFLSTSWIMERAFDQRQGETRQSIEDAETPDETTSSPGPSHIATRSGLSPSVQHSLAPYLPALISTSSSSEQLGLPYNLFEPPKGYSLSSLTSPLASDERRALDCQKGQLIRRVSELRPPNNKFGPAVAVLARSTTPEYGGGAGQVGSGGFDSWKGTFLGLMESILRDGEDMTVMLSYTTIRAQMRRLGHLLDAVTVSRLVLVTAGDDDNLLIYRSTKSGSDNGQSSASSTSVDEISGSQTTKTTTKAADTEAGSKSPQPNETDDKGKAPVDKGKDEDVQRPAGADVKLTGFRDWSLCYFGDPLFASIFSQSPSADFLEGFGRLADQSAFQRLATPPPEETGSKASHGFNEDLIEDRDNAHIRLLLYECFHAAAAIVKQFHRPSPESPQLEMAARRRLASAINSLDAIDDAVTKRQRRPSADIDTSAAKRAKSGSPERATRGSSESGRRRTPPKSGAKPSSSSADSKKTQRKP